MATKYIFLDMIFRLYLDDGTHASNPVSREISEILYFGGRLQVRRGQSEVKASVSRGYVEGEERVRRE